MGRIASENERILPVSYLYDLFFKKYANKNDEQIYLLINMYYTYS